MLLDEGTDVELMKAAIATHHFGKLNNSLANGALRRETLDG
ncbi:hypothetical protein [Myxacorys almedinensis]|nr:hypothetical protein [Myxacorys almedinensis]